MVSEEKVKAINKSEAKSAKPTEDSSAVKIKVEETKQKTPIKSINSRTPTPKKQLFKLAKEEIKEKELKEEESKVLMPFDIKKLIDSDMTNQHSILDNIGFPDSENFEKIIQSTKEISLQFIKKVQNSIQRIKATEKKLKELEKKAKENYTKKSKLLDNLLVSCSEEEPLIVH